MPTLEINAMDLFTSIEKLVDFLPDELKVVLILRLFTCVSKGDVFKHFNIPAENEMAQVENIQNLLDRLQMIILKRNESD